MGNIDSLRDWGHAKDYVKMQWMMSTRCARLCHRNWKTISVREFIIWTANALGIDLEFRGSGFEEVGVVVGKTGNLAPKINIGQEIVKIDPRYFRPAEVDTLLGDATKAKTDLGWEPQITVKKWVKKWWKKIMLPVDRRY